MSVGALEDLRNGATVWWGELATLVVVFLLYTNAPAVAVKFHGVPFIVGAMAILPLLLPLTYYLVLRRQPLVVPPALPFVVLFLMIGAGSALLSRDPQVSQSTLFEECQGVAIFLLISNVVRTVPTLRRTLWALLLAGSLLGSISVHQQLTKSFKNNYGGFGQVWNDGFNVQTAQGVVSQPRLSGPLGEKNRYAQIMIMLVPLGYMLYLGERALWLRALAILVTTLTTLGFALAFSRGAAVGFVLAIGFATLMGYVKPRQLVVAFLAAVLLLVAFPQYRARLGSLKTLASAMSESQDSDEQLDGAIKGRFTEVVAAARVFADHPLTGVGPGMFRYYAQEYGNDGGLRLLETEREAHNLYLGIAADMGALGLLCFLGMVWVTLRSLARARRACLTSNPRVANMATGFILTIVIFLTAGLNSHFSYTRYFWLMLGLAAATAYSSTSIVSEPHRVTARKFSARTAKDLRWRDA